MRFLGRRPVVPIAIAAWLAYSVWIFAGWGDHATRQTASDTVFLGFGLLGAAAAALRSRSSRDRQRIAWAAVTVGLTGWLCAAAFKTCYPLVTGTPAPFPSVADVGYLALPVGVCLALLLFVARRPEQWSMLLLLDGLVVAGSVSLVSWVSILRHLVGSGHTSTFAFVVMLAYPIADLAAVTVGLLGLGRARPGQRAPVVCLLAGIMAMAASTDAHFPLLARGGYQRGGLVDIGCSGSLLAFALAGLYRRHAPDVGLATAMPPAKVMVWLPYVPLILAGGVVAADLRRTDRPVDLLIVGILVSAVLIRQFLMVGENRRLLTIVADQAMRDSLTGLANRMLFNDRLGHAVALHRCDSRPLAVLSIDLDHFKLVNDRLGHAAGDTLLVQVAQRMLACVSTADTVARLGGDEFAILVEGGDKRVDSVVQQLVEAFDEPFVLDDRLLFIRPSVGLAVAAADTRDTSAETLLQQSDAAMYAAKRTRTGYELSATAKMPLPDPDELNLPGPSAHDSAQRDAPTLGLLDRLRHAIDHGELQLVYQPKIALRTGEVVGVEALVRWPHPDHGLLKPIQFLPLVRANRLMDAFTDVVLARVLGDAAEWYSSGHAVPVAVNLFAPSFADSDLPPRVCQAVSASGLTPDCLTLEITEDLLLRDVQETRTILSQLLQRGIRVSIDDFGSGYSGLHYLRELPIDEVKLDRQFVVRILDDSRAIAIVRAVIDLVHALDATCVAEGVENEAIAERLRDFGCDIAQGYLYSAPIANTVLLEMLKTRIIAAGGHGSPADLPVAH